MEARENQRRLTERVKELSCLYAIARIAHDLDDQLPILLQRVVEVIPQGWQFPEGAVVHLQLDEQEFGTALDSEHAMRASLIVEKRTRGTITVAYRDGLLTGQEPLFLPEEEQLLEKIAADLSSIVERHERNEQQALLEARMRNNDRLTILAEITAGIAHELNTPLGNVLGYAELLKKNETHRDRRSDLQRIIDSALIGREIVKKLMYFSCEMPAQFQLADANKALRDTVHLLMHRLDQQRINVDWRLSATPPMFRIDQVQFAQVISNLVLNAAAAMPQGGTITITSSLADALATITIADTGTGIDPENLNKVFQPFFTTKSIGEGTGLGLAVVHGIIKGHGGSVFVASTVDEGTTFTISFPASST